MRRAGKTFTPDYRWVLTRLAGIHTDRKVVARSGPFALERRQPNDITVVGGVVADDARHDPTGKAWVIAPVQSFWVTSPSTRPLWARLDYRGPGVPALTVQSPRGAKVIAKTGDRVSVCVPVPEPASRSQLRRVQLNLQFDAGQVNPPPEQFDEVQEPPRGLQLTSMSVSPADCTPRR